MLSTPCPPVAGVCTSGAGREGWKKGLMLIVANMGTGMLLATLKKIFEAFYTMKGIGETGLGLWVSRDRGSPPWDFERAQPLRLGR